MKKRILSLLLAVLMVATCVTIPAEAAEKINKFEFAVSSNDEKAVEMLVNEDYVATVNLLNDTVDQQSVELYLAMQNVAGLGIDEKREETFTFATGLESQQRSLTQYLTELAPGNEFAATVNGSVNGKGFTYEVEGASKEANGKITGTWVAEPTKKAEVQAAWAELMEYVDTDTTTADSKVVIPNGATLQIGRELLSFESEEDLVLNNLNNTSGAIDNIKANVKLETLEEADDEIVVFMPEGATLQVSSSVAVLNEDTKITVTGLELDEEATPLEDLRTAANAAENRNFELIKTAMLLVNDVIASVNGQTIDVNITTADYEDVLEDMSNAGGKVNIDLVNIMSDLSVDTTTKNIEVAEKAYNDALELLAIIDKTKLTKDQLEVIEDWEHYVEVAGVKIEKAKVVVEKEEAKAEVAAQKAAAEKAAAEKAQKEAELATLKAAAATQNEAAKKVLALTAKATAKVTVKTSGTKVTATWDAVEGAEKYAVIVVKNGKEEAPVMVTETTYEVSAPGTKVAIIVAPVATFENVEYTGKEVTSKSVVVKPARPTVKVNKSGKKFKVTVKKASVTGYQIQTAKNSKFTKNLKKYTVKGKKVSKSYKLTTLKKGTNYVRVRAYKTISGKKYYSSWSKAVKVKR